MTVLLTIYGAVYYEKLCILITRTKRQGTKEYLSTSFHGILETTMNLEKVSVNMHQLTITPYELYKVVNICTALQSVYTA